MENELKKLAAAMRDMSDMVGDHHWQAAKAIEELKALKSKKADPGEKLGADGLEVVAAAKALCKHHAELCGVNADDQWTHYSEDFLADVQIVAPYLQADAQRLLSQLRDELAQRDAEIQRMQTMSDNYCALLMDANAKLHALSPAGGGVVMPEPLKRGDEGATGEYGAAMIRGYNACLREVARLNSKPQANSQEAE